MTERKRPAALRGTTAALETNCGKLYVTVNHDPDTGLPVEVFCRFGKAGGCGSAVMDGLTRMITRGLLSGMDPQVVVRDLAGISCHRGAATCLDALAEAVALALDEGKGEDRCP
ncbi:MAG TPA: TSCPD domain-containing protein [Geobacter anodireducens]|nr:TSCPD domain-containing protein [Geobacter anodireducens]